MSQSSNNPEEDKSKAIGDLLGYLDTPEPPIPVNPSELQRDIQVAKVDIGLSSDKVMKKVIDGNAQKSLTYGEFEDLYKQITSKINELDYEDPNRDYLLSFLQGRIIEFARKDFYMFVRYLAPYTLPEGFIDGSHIRLIAKELQKVEQATVNKTRERLMVFCPPGAMKSKLINLFVAWCLGKHPKWNILHIGHGTQFVEDNAGRPIRDLMRTEEYLRVFPHVVIKSDSRAAGRWELTEGGKYYGAGVGTQIAGRRAHISICDDVVSEQTAYSPVERRKINHWYVPGLRTRLLPNGSEIIVNTRWHNEDLSGYLEVNDSKTKRPWRTIVIPAILDKKAGKLLGLPEGGSFWPEFQDLEFLTERREDPSMTAAKWSSLYMQQPVPEEGSIFKESDFQLWKANKPPEIEYIVLSLDTAYSSKTSADYSAYSVWGVFHERNLTAKGQEYWVPHLILIECDKNRWEYPELLKQVIEMNDYYKPDIILIENKASGQSLIPELQLMGYPVVPFEPQKWGDKEMRAHQVTPYFRNGRIWVPESQQFTTMLMRDALEFPFGASDDLVDTMTQAVIHLRSNVMALSNPNHMSEDLVDEDDLDERRQSRRSYWNAASGATRSV